MATTPRLPATRLSTTSLPNPEPILMEEFLALPNRHSIRLAIARELKAAIPIYNALEEKKEPIVIESFLTSPQCEGLCELLL